MHVIPIELDTACGNRQGKEDVYFVTCQCALADVRFAQRMNVPVFTFKTASFRSTNGKQILSLYAKPYLTRPIKGSRILSVLPKLRTIFLHHNIVFFAIMLSEIELEALRYFDREALERLQILARYLRDVVDRHARKLALRYIHDVNVSPHSGI